MACKFNEEPVDDRVKYIKSEKLCFDCLKPGHLSKICTKRMTCDICSKRHPTCLHADRSKKELQGQQESKKEQSKEVNNNKERKSLSTQLQNDFMEATSHRVVQDGNTTQTSAIIPVYESTASDSSKEVTLHSF